MADFGLRYPCFIAKGKTKGVVLGRLVTANLTVNTASGELYADDELAERIEVFSSGNLAMETDELSDENAAEIYGCKVELGTVTYNKDDVAPRGALAYFKVKIISGKQSFKVFYYPQVSAVLGNDNAQTRGSTITFQTTNTSFTIFADSEGDWRQTKVFETVDEAQDWINEKCGVSTTG